MLHRRDFLHALGMSAAAFSLSPGKWCFASSAPTAPVAIARCHTYGPEVQPTLATLFDKLGGLERLVKGKTVAIKINLTGDATDRLGYLPPERTFWTHPQVIGATVSLLGKAGARRIRLLESPSSTSEALEEFMTAANWEPGDFASAAPRVEFENTNYLGRAKKYSRLWVPHGGLLFRAYDLNHSYEDCDVYVSLAKLKEHTSVGVTLAMKNSFGITPCTIYGDGAGKDEPSQSPRGGRQKVVHDGQRQPSRSAVSEIDPTSPRGFAYRVPRAVVDLVAARPIHLSVIDGIETMTGGEGPWVPNCRQVRPGLLIAGTNPTTTDAVATAVMGFDPRAERGSPPFEHCDNTLMLAEQVGIGTCDLNRIEVLGLPIAKARFDFAPLPPNSWEGPRVVE